MSFTQDISAKSDDNYSIDSDIEQPIASNITTDSRSGTDRTDITHSDIHSFESIETTPKDQCFEGLSQTVVSSESAEQIEVKPILKRKSLDETEIKILPSILKKRDSFDLSSNHTILKRHSLGSDSDHRNPSQLLTTNEIDISSKPSSSSKPLSQIHSILKHKSFDEKFVQSRDDQNLPKPILKNRSLSIEDEIEKCLNINNRTNGANHSNHSNSSCSQSTNTNPNVHSFESNFINNSNTNRTRSILKTGLDHEKRVIMNKTVEMKSILKTGHKSDVKPVKSALKKSDQTVDNNKSEVKSILKTESNEKINISDTDSTSDDDTGVESSASKADGNDTNESTNTCALNHNDRNGNSVPTPNACAIKQSDENKPNQRFLVTNKKLDHKRPNSCIELSSIKTIAIDIDAIQPEGQPIGGSISERLAALKRNGDQNWKKRVPKSEPEVTLRHPNNTNNNSDNRNQTKSIANRLTQLEDSSIKWKNRVEEKDVKQFTIEAKLLKSDTSVVKTPDIQRKTPKPMPFKSEKTAEMLNSNKLQILPKILIPESNDNSSVSSSDTKVVVVSIPKTDDEDFNSFFTKQTKSEPNDKKETISDGVFDEISAGVSDLLIQKKSVRTQSRRTATSNPIRRLAARTEFIADSYTENSSTENGKNDNNLKPKKCKDLVKSSSFAASALAGLASREDIKAVAGKLRSSCSSTRDVWKSYDMPNSMLTLMLVQIKGRRRAQTRLVEHNIRSINNGDSYILVSRDRIFVWIGQFSNIIERTKTLEIANQIQTKKDLCFRSSNPSVLIDCQKTDFLDKKSNELFRKELNANKNDSISPPKSPEEDEVYEDTIIGTNMIYRVNNDQLVPYESYWGQSPKYEMLDSEEAFVFDYGSELYVWVGNKASNMKRKCALDSAKDLWNKGYNYSDCDVNPFGTEAKKKAEKRPKWCWFTKVCQNMESILFKDKFLNWPTVSSALKSKSSEKPIPKDIYSELNLSIDAKAVLESKAPEPDLILETAHLGRGVRWDDELEGRHISITSLDVKCWQISEYEKHELLSPDMYYLYSGDTYVVRWHYRLSRVGRQLKTGNISRHSMIGRDRSCYFFWHGLHSKTTEKGASALMTVELDKEKAQQVRVSEHREEPCFLNIFKGALVVLRGKRGQKLAKNVWKMFYVKGVEPNEGCLVEVESKVESLRSRTAFVFINPSCHLIYVWKGSKCLKETQEVMNKSVENLINNKSSEIGFKSDVKYSVKELEESNETKEFWDVFESHERRHRQQLYYSLIDSSFDYSYSPRLFHFTSSSGEFKAKEILCSFRSSSNVCPFPFTQEDLYSAQQPSLFMFDNQNQIWLWESKFPFSKDPNEEPEANTTTGSVGIRWYAERKCALDTALAYCYAKNSCEPPNGYVVCAGLEPLAFCNLFPEWKAREDIAKLHINDGRKPGEKLVIQEVLSQLRNTGSTQYSLEELRKRPIPEGLNPLCLESYLGSEDFKESLGMSREVFYSMPTWKQTSLKQKAELF